MAVDAAAYAKAVNAIIADRDRLSAEALRRVLASLQGARREVMDRLAAIPTTEAGTWQYYQLQQARKGLESAMADLGADLSKGLTSAALDAFRAGAGMTSAAVAAGGDAALAGRIAFGQVSTLQAVAIARHYPELVKGLTDRAVKEMGRTIQRGVLTGRPAHAIMGDLRRYLDVPERSAKRFGGLAYQAERIYTTEVNRIFAAGTEMGYARTAEVLGTDGMVRVWQHSGGGRWPRDMHIKLHGTSAPYPQGVFDVNGNPGRYPHAPELPGSEVINCRCSCLQWNTAWGPVGEFTLFPPGSDAATGRGAFSVEKAGRRQERLIPREKAAAREKVVPQEPEGSGPRLRADLERLYADHARDVEQATMAASAAQAEWERRQKAWDAATHSGATNDAANKLKAAVDAAEQALFLAREEASRLTYADLREKAHALLRAPEPTKLAQGQLLTDQRGAASLVPGISGAGAFGMRDAIQEAEAFVSSVVNDSARLLRRDINYAYHDYPGRASANAWEGKEAWIDLFKGNRTRTVVHELGHFMEAELSGGPMHPAIKRFLDERGAGEAPEKLANLFPNAGYRPDEVTVKDKFIDPYIGKRYGDRASEVLSMGLELLYRDPRAFARDDPGMFDFVIGLIRGEIRK